MSVTRFLLVISTVGLLAGGVAACSAQPYVLHANEFNRSAVDFGKDPTDIEAVTICYRSSSTTPQDVRALAVKECAAFGKTARFIKQNYLSCPLLTPVAAHYSCDVKPSYSGFGYVPY